MMTVTPITLAGPMGASVDELEQLADSLSKWNTSRYEIADAMAVLNPSDRQRLAEMIIARSTEKADDVAWAMSYIESGASSKTALRKYSTAWAIIGTASMAASAYHGYRRNRSVGWAIWWGIWGAVLPVFTPVIAVAQGFGKRK